MPPKSKRERMYDLAALISEPIQKNMLASNAADREQAQRAEALGTLEDLLGRPELAGRSVQSGPYQVGPVPQPRESDPFYKALAMEKFQEGKQKDLRTDVEQLGKSVSNLPQAVTALQRMEKVTPGIVSSPETVDPSTFKSVGPVASGLPNWLIGTSEWIGKKAREKGIEGIGLPEGALEERSGWQRLINIDTRYMTGVAAAAHEQARTDLEKALQFGGSPEATQAALNGMINAIKLDIQNKKAGTSPEALKKYLEQGGIPLEFSELFTTGMGEAKPKVTPQSSAVTPTTAAPAEQTKVVGGKTYKKVPGGWQEI